MNAVSLPVDLPGERVTFIKKSCDAVKKVIHSIDEYTSPRESTAGHFEKPSYFQACTQSAVEGFYISGLLGAAAGVLSSGTGVLAETKTKSYKMGIIAGGVTGVALQVGLGLLAGAGPSGLAIRAIAGGLLGVFFTLRGNQSSITRDSAGNANMITSIVMHGPAKLAGGIGSAVGSRFDSPVKKAIFGAATAAAIGSTLAVVGFTPVGIIPATIIAGVAGGVGPFVGPRFSQLFRNVSNDLGKFMRKIYTRVTHKSPGETKKDERVFNVAGAFPSSFLKEGIRGFSLSDGGFSGFILGGIMETVQQAQIFLCSKIETDSSKGK